MTKLAKLKEKWLKNPEVNEEYLKLSPEFEQVKKGLEDAAAGRVRYLGEFTEDGDVIPWRPEKEKISQKEKKYWADRGLKYCSKCKQVLGFGMFRKATNRKDGMRGWCCTCDDKSQKEYCKANPEKRRETYTKYNKENAEYRSLWGKVNKYKISYAHAYLLTILPKCFTCKSEQAKDKGHIDHCHETNQCRGLLCHNCNMVEPGITQLYQDNSLNTEAPLGRAWHRYLSGQTWQKFEELLRTNKYDEVIYNSGIEEVITDYKAIKGDQQ